LNQSNGETEVVRGEKYDHPPFFLERGPWQTCKERGSSPVPNQKQMGKKCTFMKKALPSPFEEAKRKTYPGERTPAPFLSRGERQVGGKRFPKKKKKDIEELGGFGLIRTTGRDSQ